MHSANQTLNQKLKTFVFTLTGTLEPQMIRNGVGNLAIRIFYTLSTFVTSILLTRFMGAEGYGKYSSIYALVMVLVVPVQLGIPILLMRETAQNLVKENYGLIKGCWRWGFQTTFVLSLVVMISFTIYYFFSQGLSLQLSENIWGLLLIPLIGLSALRSGALRGLHKIVLGQFPEYVLVPGFFILYILVVKSFVPDQLSSIQVIQARLIATLLAFLIGTIILNRHTPNQIHQSQPVYHRKNWRKSVYSLALITGMRIINKWIGFIILGLFVSDSEIGYYRIAIQMSILADIGLQLINPVINPQIARLFSLNDFKGLQHLAIISARVTLFINLAISGMFVLLGRFFLGIVYGNEFRAAYIPLIILLLGQLINAAFGSVDPFLNMTRHESETAKARVVSTVINVILVFLLAPSLGIVGASIASTVSLVIWNGMLFVTVRKQLGITSLAFQKQAHRSEES